MDITQKEKHLFLLRLSGDVSTKADGTKQRFVRRLTRNVEDALEATGVQARLRQDRFRIYLETDTAAASDPLSRVFGIQSLSEVERLPYQTLDDLVRAGAEIFQTHVRDKSFAVRARRSGNVKRIPFGSLELERVLGTALLPFARKVDLTNPEATASIEVHPGVAYFYREKLPGQGGLPLGVEGRALSLVSGGFDSAVASWLLLKRGVSLDYLFCNLGGQAHRDGVFKVMKVISDQWSYGHRPRLFEIDFAPVVAELKEHTVPRFWQVLLKRQMIRAGARLASYLRVAGIVTGEAVGQVSSQTLPNLAVISRATEFPLLRPLLGFDKDEIIRYARDIGTYVFSSTVEEYCAILPRNPSTQAPLGAILAEEAKLDPELIKNLVRDRSVTDLRATPLLTNPRQELDVDSIPPGTTVLDLRSPSAYSAWHYPDALYLDFFQALKSYPSFDKAQSYVLYCEIGQKSAHLAELMLEAGFRAVHVKQGVRSLIRQDQEIEV